MRTFLLLLAATGSLAFAPAPFPRPARRQSDANDLKAMQGTWQLVSRTVGGGTISHVVNRAEVSGTRFTLVNASGDWRSPFSLTLDLTRSPRHFVMQSEKSAYRMTGLYELSGDTLRMCYTTTGQRPVNLTGAGRQEWLDIYKRRKP